MNDSGDEFPVRGRFCVSNSAPRFRRGGTDAMRRAVRAQGVAGRLQQLLEHNTPSTVPECCKQAPSVEYARQIITYAHKLSFTTFAPQGWAPGRPLGRFRPPAPQDWQLRASQLHAAARTPLPAQIIFFMLVMLVCCMLVSSSCLCSINCSCACVMRFHYAQQCMLYTLLSVAVLYSKACNYMLCVTFICMLRL